MDVEKSISNIRHALGHDLVWEPWVKDSWHELIRLARHGAAVEAIGGELLTRVQNYQICGTPHRDRPCPNDAH